MNLSTHLRLELRSVAVIGALAAMGCAPQRPPVSGGDPRAPSRLSRDDVREDVQARPAYDALTGVRQVLTTRARMARWASVEPRPCSAYAPVARLEDLPAEVRKRLRGFVGTLDNRVSISVAFDLPAARARAYAAGCPGVMVWNVLGEELAKTFVSVGSFEALSRLAQSEAVDSIDIAGVGPVQPNGEL
jgi:hypothetical protein